MGQVLSPREGATHVDELLDEGIRQPSDVCFLDEDAEAIGIVVRRRESWQQHVEQFGALADAIFTLAVEALEQIGQVHQLLELQTLTHRAIACVDEALAECGERKVGHGLEPREYCVSGPVAISEHDCSHPIMCEHPEHAKRRPFIRCIAAQMVPINEIVVRGQRLASAGRVQNVDDGAKLRCRLGVTLQQCGR
eukprot:4904998-Prymnesium_polylepis.1